MSTYLRLIASMITLLVAGGCTTIPKPVVSRDYCNFVMQRAEVPMPPPGRIPDRNVIEPANAMLLLSGGSLHGAFGAGLLTRWKELNSGLPRFRTVTGISTGALLSTDAFIDTPEAAQRAYTIERESDLVRPFAKRNRKGGFSPTAYLSIVRNNAVADLGPLRQRLHDHISMDVLREVVSRSNNRRLLVGAVDVDSGDAVIFDMVDMAKRAVAASGAKAEHFRDCYVDAIVASSSVPLAARPVIIDNRMYVDGGARFGVFLDNFGNDAGTSTPGPATAPPKVYIVINGMQRVGPECGKVDHSLCARDSTDAYDNRDGAHAGWNLLGLAQRSSDILIAQIYRFSAADIASRYRERYGSAAAKADLHYFQIDADAMLTHPFESSTCGDIHADEEARLHPLQFYPRYMACLIDYGRAFADWNADALRIGRP